MAIFRAETKHISRSKKDNVVSAAAYRSGEKLTDTNKFNPDAKTHDYTRKQGVMAKGIILPSSLIEQNFTIGRQQLWSSVEQHETTTRSVKGSRLKQTARLAREWLLALPTELSDEENEQLTAEFTQRLANDLGVIGDYCIHKPTVGNYKPKADYIESYDPGTQKIEKTRVYDLKATEPDSRNIHAHIMFTTRKVELDKGSLVFGEKADSERSEKWRQEKGLSNGGDYLKEIRHLWADMVNERLEQKHILPITAKSYKDLGINIIPQQKQGKDASTLALYGFKPPIIGYNNDFREQNKAYIKSAADRCIARESQSARERSDSIESANRWLSGANNSLAAATPRPFNRESNVKRLSEQTIRFNQLAERANRNPADLDKNLIQQAVKRYRGIVQYDEIMERPDLARKRPRANPYLPFNERQVDIIKYIHAHIEGSKKRHTSYSLRENERIDDSSLELEVSLAEPINRRLLILLADPIKEQKHYEIYSAMRQEAFDTLISNRKNLTIENSTKEIEQESNAQTLKSAPYEVLEVKSMDDKEKSITPPKTLNTYTPRFN
jgi:hypothetical protein